MHAQLMSHLYLQQVRAGRGSQVEILNSTYGGKSPTNTMVCMEHLKDADLP